jgi:acyl carrier protein
MRRRRGPAVDDTRDEQRMSSLEAESTSSESRDWRLAEPRPQPQPPAGTLPAAAAPQEAEPMPDVANVADRVKRLIVENLHLDGLRPEMIDEEAPLFGDGLGLDSVDALELVVAVEKEFGIKIKSNEIGRDVFTSVASLSRFIAGRL